jgi:hypothetical protein
MYVVHTYVAYLVIAVAVTLWVARALRQSGRVFIQKRYPDTALGDAVNHLIVVGFCLVNCGFIALMLSSAVHPDNAQQGLELLSVKVGAALLFLGVTHVLNVAVLARLRRNVDQEVR